MKRQVSRKARLDALTRESDRALTDQVRRLLRRAPEQRTHLLRKRVAVRASCL